MTDSNSAPVKPTDSNSASLVEAQSNSAFFTSVFIYGSCVFLQYNALLNACINLAFGETPSIPSSAFLYLFTGIVCLLSYGRTTAWQDIAFVRVYFILGLVAVVFGMATYVADIIAHSLIIAFFGGVLLRGRASLVSRLTPSALRPRVTMTDSTQ